MLSLNIMSVKGPSNTGLKNFNNRCIGRLKNEHT